MTDDKPIEVDDVFSPGGMLSSKLEGYEPRNPQIEMARWVAKAFEVEKNLIVEAPTGTGKSLAYLVPSILRAVETEGRVVVATANIALQEQLVEKDLPFLQDLLPVDFDFALMKGRNNYVCKEALDCVAQGKLKFSAGNASWEEMIVKWAAETELGDKSELEFIPPDDVWRLFSVTGEDCLGKKCTFAKTCFANSARAKLNDCQVIVSNYHLLFAHMTVRLDTGMNVVLPGFDYLICDEGHKIADIARSFFGWTVSGFGVTRLTRALEAGVASAKVSRRERESILEMVKEVGLAGDRMWHTIVSIYSDKEASPKRLKKKGMINSQGLESALGRMMGAFELLADKTEGNDGVKLKKHGERCLAIAGQLNEINSVASNNAVYFIDRGGKSNYVRLNKRSLDVSEALWAGLYEETKCSVITSATLAVDNNCKYIRKEIGLKKARELVVGSPFNYQNQGLLVLSGRAPNPTQEDFTIKVCQTLEYVIKEADGRTLALFTSYKNLRAAKEYLSGKDGMPTILCQGDLPRMQLVKAFKEDVSSVLLGTESFWSGVDVPGEACSCVVIDRIPFKSPGDPVWEALTEKSDNWFFELAIPAAAIQLKQGVGRLIRRRSDYGVAIILDQRMITKQYGRTLIHSLSGMRRFNTLRGVVRSWLARENI